MRGVYFGAAHDERVRLVLGEGGGEGVALQPRVDDHLTAGLLEPGAGGVREAVGDEHAEHGDLPKFHRDYPHAGPLSPHATTGPAA